jgi:hypothetical protein
VSRRFSAAAGFYKTCVIDGILEHSPAEHVRRPSVPAESPTLGFTCLQFEGLLTAARESLNRSDFALVAMLGLLGLRIFEATGADIADLGEEHGHRVPRVCGKGGKVVLIPRHRPLDGPSTVPQLPGPAARSCSIAAVPGWTAMPPPAACGAWPTSQACGSPGRTRTCSVIPSLPHAGRGRGLAGRADRRPARRPAHHDALRQLSGIASAGRETAGRLMSAGPNRCRRLVMHALLTWPDLLTVPLDA